MYTKTNMITTLERARKLLAQGYVKGKWICKTKGPDGKCHLKCCAEGAIAIASGAPRRTTNHFSGGDYGEKLLALVNETSYSVMGSSIQSVNDNYDLNKTDSVFVKTIQKLKEQRNNG